MGASGTLIDIVIFAAIAIFLVLRLRSVLGRRNGEERQRPNPFAQPDTAAYAERNGASPFPGTAPTRLPAPPAASDEPQSLDARLQAYRAADPSFDEKHFLAGARTAFQMIVNAFAAGDLGTLKPLLAAPIYADFAHAVEARRTAGHTLTTTIHPPVEADLTDARVENGQAHIEVRFTSQQVNATRDTSGAVIDGDAENAVEITDLWTFARDIRARDPNWQLIATDHPG